MEFPCNSLPIFWCLYQIENGLCPWQGLPITKMANWWWVWAEERAACLIRCWWLGRTFSFLPLFGWSQSTCHSFLWDLYSLCMQDLFFTCDQNVTGVSLGVTAAEPGSRHLLFRKRLVAVFSYVTTKHCRLFCLLLQMQVAFFGLLCSWRTLWQHYTKILLFQLSCAVDISFPWREEQSLD